MSIIYLFFINSWKVWCQFECEIWPDWLSSLTYKTLFNQREGM